MNIEKLVLDLCAYDDEQEWFEFKENWFEPHALENIFLVCPMRRQWWARNMRTLYGE